MNVRSPGVTKPLQHQVVSYYYDEVTCVVSIVHFRVLTNIKFLSKLKRREYEEKTHLPPQTSCRTRIVTCSQRRIFGCCTKLDVTGYVCSYAGTRSGRRNVSQYPISGQYSGGSRGPGRSEIIVTSGFYQKEARRLLFLWTRGESNPFLNYAIVPYYRYTTGPDKWT